ncbi:MAG: alpha/beta fold hydrolase [Prevotellaceae bacterium]|jgi:dienelactone hydrolase|nr:alpha/beta fold hydrolase [Prevotellaceae bacterium]
MRNLIKIILLTSILTGLLSCGSKADESIIGQWKGAIQVSGLSLNLVFDFKKADGKLTANFYSIDQTNKKIEASNVKFKNDSIKVEIFRLGAIYQGALTDSMIVGVFTQMGNQMALDLKKITTEEFNSYVNESGDDGEKLYTSSDVTFENAKAGISLAGTITVPKEGSNFPAVVLVSGSGAQNRDEEMMGQKPFKRIADYLSNRGIAVLRYDDRGIDHSGGNFATATTHDFLEDAIAATEFLKAYDNIDKNKIGIIGHSEGALISMMAAAENKVSFIVALAGPTITGEDLLLLQAWEIGKASGNNEAALNAARTLNSAIYTILKKEPDNKKAKLDMIATIKHYAPNDEMKKDAVAEKMANTVLNPWFRTFITLDPAGYIQKIKCPTLFLFGEKDLQVPVSENKQMLYKLFNNNIPANISLSTVADVNHLFQKAEKGLPNEYANRENPVMNNETLQKIYDWMKESML